MIKLFTSILFLFSLALFSCNIKPKPIKLGVDVCTFCKMNIADYHFGAEIITKKGETFKFDDIYCLLQFRKSGSVSTSNIEKIYLVNYNEPHNFIIATKAFLLESNELHSPMGGNIAAFENEDQLKDKNQKIQGKAVFWKELIKEK